MSLNNRIFFNYRGVKFRVKESNNIKAWLYSCCSELGFSNVKFHYIFVSREAITTLNQQFLKHNYSTDIISFTYNEDNEFRAEYYLCPEEILENAKQYGQSFVKELQRVMIHGILHSAGYNDLTDDEYNRMKSLEDEYLAKYGRKRQMEL